MNKNSKIAVRARLFWFEGDPVQTSGPAYRYIEDGLLHVEDGLIRAAGEAKVLLPQLANDVTLIDHRPHLVMPSFIDAHIHFPQTQVIASYGEQLLDWLQKYTFPAEMRYADPALAAENARFFVDTLLNHGTTTAVVYGSVHPQSVDAFFAESERRNTRMIAGKVMMDRNAPPDLLDTAQRGFDESEALISRWHRRGRQLYAITPRFAITSTFEQLEACGALVTAHPDCYVQTHLSENLREIELAQSLFPAAVDYTDIYDSYGLLGPRSLFGHCIHLSERELARFCETQSVAVFCPTSNLFIGSGLFDWARVARKDRPVPIALATDVGGGTSYSMLQTAAEAYKVLQLQGQSLSALTAFYTLTLGNAKALQLQDKIGSFAPGCEADFVVLDAHATPIMAHRMACARDLLEELFVLMTLGDDRAIAATYVMGQRHAPMPSETGTY